MITHKYYKKQEKAKKKEGEGEREREGERCGRERENRVPMFVSLI